MAGMANELRPAMLTTVDGAAGRPAAHGARAQGGWSLGLAPLGVPLRIELDRAGDRFAVEAACAGWQGRPERSARTLRLTLACSPALSGSAGVEVAVDGRRLALRGPGGTVGAGAARGEAWCLVSNDYLAAPERLRAEVLEPLILFLVTRNGRVPLHAAAVKSGELAILLMGPSGSGKSSLALAADRAGWLVMAEDTVYLQREPAPRFRGCPGLVHLLPRDCRGGPNQARLRNGKLKYAVRVRRRHPDALVAGRAAACLLARGETVALERLGPTEALSLAGPVEAGFDLLAAEIRAAHELLMRDGAWRLTLSSRPAEAIELLSASLPLLRASAAPAAAGPLACAD